MVFFNWWNEPVTKDAYNLSVVSLIIEIVAAALGCILYVVSGSSLALVYGLENIVDFLSSAVVLWRFYAPSSVDADLEAKLAKREKRASVAISMILIILGISVLIAALDDFVKGKEDTGDLNGVIVLAFFSILVFGSLTTIKFKFSVALDSPSLYKDGVCSMIGTICAIGLFINGIIIQSSPSAYWIDPTVAMLAGIGSVIFGCHGVHEAMFIENIPIFSLSWWMMSDDSAAGGTLPSKAPQVEMTHKEAQEENDLV